MVREVCLLRTVGVESRRLVSPRPVQIEPSHVVAEEGLVLGPTERDPKSGLE